MISLLISLAVLIYGYIVYGRFTEKVFSPDNRTTPAISKNDGVDFVPMKTWKSFLVRFLGGAVHDYMSGMISARHDGASIAELSGTYLGKRQKQSCVFFRLFCLFSAELYL